MTTHDIAQTLFTRMLESPEFDAASPGARTRICQEVAQLATQYANDENKF